MKLWGFSDYLSWSILKVQLDPIYEPDQIHNSFITNKGLYSYRVLSFSLKYTDMIYQKMMNSIFSDDIGRVVEVYIDNMVIKSKKYPNHL